MISIPPYSLQGKLFQQSQNNQAVPLGELKPGLGITASTGMITLGMTTPGFLSVPDTPWLPGVQGGVIWRAITSDRDLKAEITSNVQASFNTAINLLHIPAYLGELRNGDSTFSVIMRWTSQSSHRHLSEDQIQALIEQLNKPALNKAELGDNFIVGVTTRAWAIGVWQVDFAADSISEAAFEDIRLKTMKYFATPRKLEDGCDYLSRLSEV